MVGLWEIVLLIYVVVVHTVQVLVVVSQGTHPGGTTRGRVHGGVSAVLVQDFREVTYVAYVIIVVLVPRAFAPGLCGAEEEALCNL